MMEVDPNGFSKPASSVGCRLLPDGFLLPARRPAVLPADLPVVDSTRRAGLAEICGWHGALARYGWQLRPFSCPPPRWPRHAALHWPEPHGNPPRPCSMIRWLQAQYAPAKRPVVWLILRDSLRHAQWYGPEFDLIPADTTPTPLPPRILYSSLRSATAYTDDPVIAAKSPDVRPVAAGADVSPLAAHLPQAQHGRVVSLDSRRSLSHRSCPCAPSCCCFAPTFS